MNKLKLGLPVLAIVLVAAWYAFRPERIITNHTVNEAFPAPAEASSAQVVESGTFYGVVHPTTGSATIYRLADGDRFLRLTSFKTWNAPDVHVYMVATDDSRDSTKVKRSDFIDLGTIKGNIGDQNYPLGSDVDLSKYRTVSIWCERFAQFRSGTAETGSHDFAELNQIKAGLPSRRLGCVARRGGAWHLRHYAAIAALPGSVKWNVAPRSEFAAAQIRPPCASTIERVMASPRPVP